ncbi:efflux RND transporter permease subunit [Cohaesibacter sp. CAU 1516]|uniref:efflux RND transporter permease subunit n=1 Tax=Cohaesibacter sp. CAU 1516 TaxID=2576038 RepID=UPI0010FE8D10|nr:efflux RND transporter permease subunit [Cohaesibacter sp. CAU 1516]TLP43437.1 efflux RND transporter permease subunit [Cohaesibacter sp. CAU 1516]
MNLTDYAIERKTVSWMVTILLLAGGVLAFFNLGRLEDPEFTIKQAVVVTAYPGASSMEVEEEVTLPIETAIQQLPYVDHVTSISSAGLSQVTVEMKSIYRKKDLAQIWDEMRRKINDLAPSLPLGSRPPVVNDDFGDVYGMFMAVTGAGYSHQELNDYVDFLRRELVLVDGVGKVSIGGGLERQIIIEINRAKLNSHNISVTALKQLLQNQNLVTNAGNLRIGTEFIRISSTGNYSNVEQIRDILLGQTGDELIYLSDVANVKIDYVQPPRHVYHFNSENALTIGVSFASGVNVVEVGQSVRARLAELDYTRPIGVELATIYDQPRQVENSVNDFLVSLGQALAIVVVVLLLTMGARSGVLMSLILLLTICATFIVMDIYNINLHRISLGALIIALGMLVDNAIVITDGILIGIKQGLSTRDAAKRIVGQTMWPLFGATVISVTAFAPIGLSPDASGEFTGSLFWILFISLLISWLFAITLTPFLASVMFRGKKPTKDSGNESDKSEIDSSDSQQLDDPYQSIFYQIYKGLLLFTLRWRWVTTFVMIATMATAVYGFKYVNKAFFPPSNLPMFTADYWLPQGSDIRSTIEDMAALEVKIRAHEGIDQVTTTVGTTAERFMLTYQGERSFANFGQFIIRVKSYNDMPEIRNWVLNLLKEEAPQAFVKTNQFQIGPATKAKIEARLSGPDPEELRRLASEVIDIYRDDPDTINIRNDWRERSKVLQPQFAEAEARRLGISKADIDSAILMNVKGLEIAKMRDGSSILPIILRPPLNERSNVEQLSDIQVFSPVLNRYVSIDQVVQEIGLAWEDPLVMRRDRKRTIQVWVDADPNSDTNSFALFERLRPQVEALDLPPGYELSWGGEFEAQSKANKAVFAFVPLGVLVMFAITIMLFNSFRQTMVVWLTLPLAVIGVTSGLLTFNQPFAFTALLGFLSLSGMLLKNGIVLIEEIKRLNEEEGLNMHDSITRAAVSRMRPVTMAAITTVLGLIPLLSDVFFAPLAVTIMFGLAAATILTLIVVPVLFSIFYGVSYRRGETI